MYMVGVRPGVVGVQGVPLGDVFRASDGVGASRSEEAADRMAQYSIVLLFL